MADTPSLFQAPSQAALVRVADSCAGAQKIGSLMIFHAELNAGGAGMPFGA